MGADYYAKSYFEVPVSRSDFVDRVEDIEVLCDHAEAKGNKFCPTCGAAEGDRKRTVVREIPKPEVAAAMEGWYDLDEPSWEAWLDRLTEWEGDVNGFNLRRSGDYWNGYDYDNVSLKWPVHNVHGRGHEGEESMSARKIDDLLSVVETRLMSMGLGDKVPLLRFTTALYISV